MNSRIKWMLISIVFIAVYEVMNFMGAAGVNIGGGYGTYVSILLLYIALFVNVFAINKFYQRGDIKYGVIIKLLIIWNIITIVRGGLYAEDYWDWKFLIYSNIPALLVPLSIYIGSNKELVQRIFAFMLKLFLLVSLLLILLYQYNTELFPRENSYLFFLLIFTPYMRAKWRWYVLGFCLLSVLLDITFRSNMLRMVAALLLPLIYYFRWLITVRMLELLRNILFFIPIVLFAIAVSGGFNVFRMNDYMDEVEYDDENLTADTRTFLYVENLNTLQQNGSLFYGEGGSGKYRSDFFDYLDDGRGRYSSEVGVLNVLLHSGIIGVILYGLIYYLCSFVAINRSNNILAKMLGLFIVYRWTLFFVEEFTSYNINFYFLWLMMGLCLSKSFREMTDDQMKQWVRGITDKRIN